MFEVDGELRETVGILRLNGSLDVSNAGVFRDAYRGLKDKGARWFVLDMTRLEFIDSSGLGVVIKIYSDNRKQDKLALVGCPDQIWNVFRVAGVSNIANRFTDLQEALAVIGSQTA